jgi:hypothetical protein
MNEESLPKEPETEKGKQVRSQYLSLAKSHIKDVSDYSDLFKRYANNPSGAQALDRDVARAALQAGNPPRQVIQLLAQGPFTQQRASNLSAEEKRTALPQLLQYTQSIVEEAQQQRYLEYACAVTGKVQSYPDLYREHVGSDLAAIQLDQKVVAAALGAGESADAIASLLHQGPYARFQLDVKNVQPSAMEQYTKGTVAQVQAIQSLQTVQHKQGKRATEKEL